LIEPKTETPEPPPPLTLETTTQFDRDVKRQEKRGKRMAKLHIEDSRKIVLGGGPDQIRPLRWWDSVRIERVADDLKTTTRDDP